MLYVNSLFVWLFLAKPVPAKPTNFTVETVFKNNNNGQFKNMLTSETPIVVCIKLCYNMLFDKFKHSD